MKRSYQYASAAIAWACFVVAVSVAANVWDLNGSWWWLALVTCVGITAASIITIKIRGARTLTNPPSQATGDPGWWTRHAYALVADGDVIAVVRDPGERSDDELRARVNATELAVVVRQPGTDPDFTIADWPCDICGGRRLFDQISVAHPTSSFAPGFVKMNLRYCNDRPHCTQVATTVTAWPPTEAGDTCIPALKLHATPHRGCVLR